MSFNFTTLGGLLSFRFINKVEDMNLEDLQEVYDDLKEEFDDVEKDYKDFKGEMAKLKDLIDKKNPEERKEKIKKKLKPAKAILEDKDIPYEVRMKYIIDAYRKDQIKWAKLAEYAKHLEGEVIRLKEILIENGYTDNAVLGDYEPSKELKELRDLRAQVKQLEAKNKELKKTMNGFNVTGLENIISTYPLKIYKAHSFKNIIKSQKRYIEELQDILDNNDIPYALRSPASQLEVDGVDEIVEEAGKFLKMHKETIEKIIEKWESA